MEGVATSLHVTTSHFNPLNTKPAETYGNKSFMASLQFLVLVGTSIFMSSEMVNKLFIDYF